MHEVATDVLDVLGLLAVAAGVLLGLWPVVHGWALVPAGAVVIAGSALSAWRSRRSEP